MTHDKLSAIGRVAILTSASEESSDPYVEVTTADARMLLDEHRKLAEQLAKAHEAVVAVVRRAQAAEARLGEYADTLNAIAVLVEGSGPQCVDRAALDAILGTVPEKQPTAATGDLGTFERLSGAPAKPEPDLHYTLDGVEAACGVHPATATGHGIRLAFDPGDSAISCLDCRAYLAGLERTPDQWCDVYGFLIADPDGWRQLDRDWTKPLGLREFYARACESTSNGAVTGAFDRIARDLATLPDGKPGTPGTFRIGDVVQITGRGDSHEPDALRLNGRTGVVTEIDDNPEYSIGLTVDGWAGLVWCSSAEVRHYGEGCPDCYGRGDDFEGGVCRRCAGTGGE